MEVTDWHSPQTLGIVPFIKEAMTLTKEKNIFYIDIFFSVAIDAKENIGIKMKQPLWKGPLCLENK